MWNHKIELTTRSGHKIDGHIHREHNFSITSLIVQGRIGVGVLEHVLELVLEQVLQVQLLLQPSAKKNVWTSYSKNFRDRDRGKRF